MIDLQRQHLNGYSVGDYLETLPYYLDSEGVRIWSIPPTAQGFEFKGADRIEFVRTSLLSLLLAGGLPVRHADCGPLLWREQTHYGKTTQEIADAIVAEWLAAGGGDLPWGWLWFVNRHILETEPNVEV